jgi:hypothetical protein
VTAVEEAERLDEVAIGCERCCICAEMGAEDEEDEEERLGTSVGGWTRASIEC